MQKSSIGVYRENLAIFTANGKDSHGNADLQTTLRELVFPSQPFVRELYISVAETEFKGLPAPLEHDLRSWLTCQGSTLLNENLNKFVKSMENKATPTNSGRGVRGIASCPAGNGVSLVESCRHRQPPREQPRIKHRPSDHAVLIRVRVPTRFRRRRCSI